MTYYNFSDEDEVNLGINTALRKQVIDLLQNGSEKDLNAVSNMNAKKLDLILANRPYDNWLTTVRIFITSELFNLHGLIPSSGYIFRYKNSTIQKA